MFRSTVTWALLTSLVCSLALVGCAPKQGESRGSTVRAAEPKTPAPPDPVLLLHQAAIVVDTHDDVTQRLVMEGLNLDQRLTDGHTDLPRMREGGLDAEFLSVWVSPKLYPGEHAYAAALVQFDAIDRMIAANPGAVVLARDAAQVRAAAADDKTAFLIGVEGGHALGDVSESELLERLHEFYERGARYMTLTWSNSNRLGGSSGDEGANGGLTSFGKLVVRTMNEMGMVVDISHVSDATFADVMQTTQRPVLASHSSARALSDHPRNMTDEMLRAVHDNGGAVCINFGPQFLDADWAKAEDTLHEQAGPKVGEILAKHPGDAVAAQREIWALFQQLSQSLPKVPASRVIDHIEHVARVAGIDHVCLGSDYDGIAATPEGLDDVSKLPFVTRELLRRGFSEADVRKVLGENVLRVMAASQP